MVDWACILPFPAGLPRHLWVVLGDRLLVTGDGEPACPWRDGSVPLWGCPSPPPPPPALRGWLPLQGVGHSIGILGAGSANFGSLALSGRFIRPGRLACPPSCSPRGSLFQTALHQRASPRTVRSRGQKTPRSQRNSPNIPTPLPPQAQWAAAHCEHGLRGGSQNVPQRQEGQRCLFISKSRAWTAQAWRGGRQESGRVCSPSGPQEGRAPQTGPCARVQTRSP